MSEDLNANWSGGCWLEVYSKEARGRDCGGETYGEISFQGMYSKQHELQC